MYTTTPGFYPDSGAQAQISPRLCSEYFAGWASSSTQYVSLHSGVESLGVRQAESFGKSQIRTRKIYNLIFPTLQVKCRISFHERRQPENLLWYLWPGETIGIFIHTANAASYFNIYVCLSSKCVTICSIKIRCINKEANPLQSHDIIVCLCFKILITVS